MIFCSLEEARLKKEREEFERLEKKRLEQEKWEKLEAKDLERKNEEAAELSLLERCFSKAEQMKREVRLISQWKHYLQCDGHPDPTVAQEINTYISLWREETNETFEQVIQKSDQVLNLIDKLMLMLFETPPFDLQHKNITQYKGSILELQDLLFLKFNRATEILLRQASALADLDSGNMEKVIQAENITVYLWANLKKNPRQRSVRFCGSEIGFEIPRVLATSDIALRLLHTHFDHVSPLPTVTPFDHAPEPGGEDTAVKAAGSALAETAASPEPEAAAGSPEPEAAGSSEAEALDSLVESPTEDLLSAQDEETEAPEEAPEEPRPESSLHVTVGEEEDPKAGTQELELALLSQRVSAAQLKMLENVQDKPHFFEDDEVDMCQFSTLGGVYHLDVLELPPQCKPMKGWVIVRTDGISHTSYNPESRLVSFSMETFSPVTLIQDTHINMPFQYWELVPLDVNQALFTVKTVFAKIQIHIKAREHNPEEESIQDIDCMIVMFTGDRAQRLHVSEYSEDFSEQPQEGSEFHSTLYHMVTGVASPAALDNIRNSSALFVDTVCHMLLSTRPLSYS
nr:unnamed protein product [Sorex araneus]